jgi:hypothetical protein
LYIGGPITTTAAPKERRKGKKRFRRKKCLLSELKEIERVTRSAKFKGHIS